MKRFCGYIFSYFLYYRCHKRLLYIILFYEVYVKWMCWNATVSLNTYAFAIFTIVFAIVNKYYKNNEAAYGILFVFASMQLVEGMVWLTLSNGQNWNRALSMAAFALIVLEPLVQLLTIRGHPQLRNWLLVAYAVFSVVVFFSMTHIDFRMIPAANGHLEWKWINPFFETAVGWCILLIWLTFFMLPPLINRTYLAFAFMLGTFILSVACFIKGHTAGSMWCWMSNIIFVYITVNILFIQPCLVRK